LADEILADADRAATMSTLPHMTAAFISTPILVNNAAYQMNTESFPLRAL
jgi:hypothetical protein